MADMANSFSLSASPWYALHVLSGCRYRILSHLLVGLGVVFEASEVRWSHVSRLLRALCSFAANGQVWRIGGQQHEPMHKFYDTEHSGSGYAQRKAPFVAVSSSSD